MFVDIDMATSRVSSSTRKSCIWSFFTVCAVDETKAVCNTCGEKFSQGGKTAKTYTMLLLLNKNLKILNFNY